jgi:Mor family transcriptional regulator
MRRHQQNDLQAELFALGGYDDNGRLTIDGIVELVGVEAAHKLAQDFGGTRVYVPVAPHDAHPLARSIGTAAAAKIGASFGGEELEIPLIKSRAQRRRDRERIICLHRAGKAIASIAREVRCSERHVYNVLSERR